MENTEDRIPDWSVDIAIQERVEQEAWERWAKSSPPMPRVPCLRVAYRRRQPIVPTLLAFAHSLIP